MYLRILLVLRHAAHHHLLRRNDKLDNAAVPVLWMGNEAQHAGLRLKPSPVEWDWEELEKSQKTESLTSVWRLFELLPFKRLSYADGKSVVWSPHWFEGRRIKPGQKIHASVAFKKGYTPEAILPENGKGWDDILEKGSKTEFSWTENLGDILEMDLFDLSKTPILVEAVISSLDAAISNLDRSSFDRLRFLAKTREGAASIGKADSELKLFATILNSKSELVLCEQSAQILLHLAGYDTIRRALTWLKVIDALTATAAVEDFSSFELRAQAFGLLSLLCTHFNFGSTEALKSFTTNLDYNIDHISYSAKSSGMLALGEFNYILYLGHRAGIDDSVSTFEHYWRHRLPASPSKSPSAAASVYLDKSVKIYGYGKELTDSDPLRPEYIRRLATSLQARFCDVGVDHGDLDQVILLLEKVKDTQNGNDRETTTSLADTLAVRFMLSRNPQDIDHAIQLYRSQVESHPAPHPYRSIAQNHLARALFEQGMQEGDFNQALDECIRLHEDVVLPITPSDSVRACSLTILAAAKQKRFGRKVADEVIRLHQEAAALCLPLDLPTALDNLCNSVCNKYTADLIREAITRFNDILQLHNKRSTLTGITLDIHHVLGEHLHQLDGRVARANLGDSYRKSHFRPQAGVKYRFTIHNGSAKDLFPYLFYFDPEKYTIDCWNTTPSTHTRPPLKSEGGIVAIGAGSERTFDFALPEGEIGFIKLFMSTKNLDPERMKQVVSPFDPGFKGMLVSLDQIREQLAAGEWGSLTVVLTMSSE
ncbi:hypothetical protein B0H19DRAFT_1265495 [Mycena capillaripes]|nr:hypothetical protein B0H19DRAFT_1265495 [Mycena capillaripes]